MTSTTLLTKFGFASAYQRELRRITSAPLATVRRVLVVQLAWEWGRSSLIFSQAADERRYPGCEC